MVILYKIHNSLITGHPGKENTLTFWLRIFLSYVICKITAVLFKTAKYAPVPKYGESKEKAF